MYYWEGRREGGKEGGSCLLASIQAEKIVREEILLHSLVEREEYSSVIANLAWIGGGEENR